MKRILPLTIMVMLAVGYVAIPIISNLRRKSNPELIAGRIEPSIEDPAMAHIDIGNFPWPPTIYDDVLPSSRTVWRFQDENGSAQAEPTADDAGTAL